MSSSVLLVELESGWVARIAPPCGEYSDTSGRRAGDGRGTLIGAL